MISHFSAHAKFLISAEYLVLHGAQALALPLTRFGQELWVKEGSFAWEAFDEKGKNWISQSELSKIRQILKYIKTIKPECNFECYSFTTKMNFSPTWGLGSSSTLVSLLAQWARVDAYELQRKFFGGSGYDVACATANTPILYHLSEGKPQITPVKWDPPFKQHLRFIYQGRKQDSRKAIEAFHKQASKVSPDNVAKGSKLTNQMLKASTLEEFQRLMLEHENYLSSLLGVEPVKNSLYPDAPGELKSLGGWGGDFILCASSEDPTPYFQNKGMQLIFQWDDLN